MVGSTLETGKLVLWVKSKDQLWQNSSFFEDPQFIHKAAAHYEVCSTLAY